MSVRDIMPDVQRTDEAERHTGIREDVAKLFRAEALEHYQRGQVDEAHLLELDPRWMRRAYAVIVALIVAAVAGAFALRGLFGW